MCQVYIYFSIHIIMLLGSEVVPLLDPWLVMGSVEINYVAPLLVQVSIRSWLLQGSAEVPPVNPAFLYCLIGCY